MSLVKPFLREIYTFEASPQDCPNLAEIMNFFAGGHLALLADYSIDESGCPPQHRLEIVINFYGPADLALLFGSSGTQG
jgi:hypothetical protein